MSGLSELVVSDREFENADGILSIEDEIHCLTCKGERTDADVGAIIIIRGTEAQVLQVLDVVLFSGIYEVRRAGAPMLKIQPALDGKGKPCEGTDGPLM